MPIFNPTNGEDGGGATNTLSVIEPDINNHQLTVDDCGTTLVVDTRAGWWLTITGDSSPYTVGESVVIRRGGEQIGTAVLRNYDPGTMSIYSLTTIIEADDTITGITSEAVSSLVSFTRRYLSLNLPPIADCIHKGPLRFLVTRAYTDSFGIFPHGEDGGIRFQMGTNRGWCAYNNTSDIGSYIELKAMTMPDDTMEWRSMGIVNEWRDND